MQTPTQPPSHAYQAPRNSAAYGQEDRLPANNPLATLEIGHLDGADGSTLRAQNVVARGFFWRIRRASALMEWPTLGLFVLVYAAVPSLLWLVSGISFAQSGPFKPLFSVAVWLPAIYLVALHASLQHEALHGHPFRDARWNTLLAVLPIGLFIPYARFKRLHLRHHCNENLTDPYDDPESFYLAQSDMQALPIWLVGLLKINNTLLGRLTLGPALSLFAFYRSEIALYLNAPSRRPQLLRIWLSHAVLVIALLLAIWSLGVSPLLYAAFIAYPAMSLLMLRTFAEHQAAEAVGPRTAIIESNPILALLYLNNNLHFVHHRFPNAPWYHLPELYRTHYDQMLDENNGYHINGYATLFRRYWMRSKEPVAHPFRRRS